MVICRARILAASAAMVLAASGCVTTGTANVESAFDPAKRATGLVAMSLTVSGYVPGTHWYQIVDSNNPQTPISIPTNAESFGLDWSSVDRNGKNAVGRLAVIELPPGSYEVRRWIMNVGNVARFSSKRPIGYRFEVVAGETVYVGNVHTDIQRTASPNSVPYLTEVSNEQTRDLPILLSKYTRLRKEDVRIRVSGHSGSRDIGPGTLDGLRDLLQ
jgi:hypothetical protein